MFWFVLCFESYSCGKLDCNFSGTYGRYINKWINTNWLWIILAKVLQMGCLYRPAKLMGLFFIWGGGWGDGTHNYFSQFLPKSRITGYSLTEIWFFFFFFFFFFSFSFFFFLLSFFSLLFPPPPVDRLCKRRWTDRTNRQIYLGGEAYGSQL